MSRPTGLGRVCVPTASCSGHAMVWCPRKRHWKALAHPMANRLQLAMVLTPMSGRYNCGLTGAGRRRRLKMQRCTGMMQL